MTTQKITEELLDKLDLDGRQSGYVDLQKDKSCVDGWFSSAELRLIADYMDKLNDLSHGP